MRALRALVLFLTFFLDVHVRAEALTGPAVRPELALAKGALAELRGAEGIALVRGTFLLREGRTFMTPFAKFSCAGECAALVQRESELVVFSNLSGEWRVNRVGDPQTYAIPQAMQVSVRPVGLDGRADLEFPQALPWDATIKVWGRLFPGDAKAFRAHVEEFREVWEGAVEDASRLFENTARREIASHEAGLASERARRAAREREDAELRARFRENNFPTH